MWTSRIQVYRSASRPAWKTVHAVEEGTSLELGTVRAETKQVEMTSLQIPSLRNKIKQLVRNQSRSRTQGNYRGSINLIYIHTDFLKPLFNWTNQRLHKNWKQRNYRLFPQEPSLPLFLPKNPHHLSFFLYKVSKTDLWLWICKALFSVSCSLFYTTECTSFLVFPRLHPFISITSL